MILACARCPATAPAPVDGAQVDGWTRRTTATGFALMLCPKCAELTAHSSRQGEDAAAARLRLLIERLEEERASIASDIRDVFSEAKSAGYQTRVLKRVIRLRRMAPNDRAEEEHILDTYKTALGME